MLSYLAAALALGIAGFDPVGSFVLLGALGMGARRSGVAALTIASVSTSFMLAVPGILGLTALLEHLGIRSLAIPHVVGVWMALACGVGLVVWGVVRVVRRPSPDDLDEQERRPRSVSTGALVGSGVLVGVVMGAGLTRKRRRRRR